MEFQRALAAIDEAAQQASLLIQEYLYEQHEQDRKKDVEAALNLLQQRWRELRTLLTKDAPANVIRAIWQLSCALWVRQLCSRLVLLMAPLT